MWIIKPGAVRAYADRHADAAEALNRWMFLVKRAEWRNFSQLRAVFRSADEVGVASGRKVVVFNIGGNNYRLIAAVRYNLGKVFVLRFMTHAEYDKGKWKASL